MRGSTQLNYTILTVWAAPFAGRVRAVFLNSVACNLMASRRGSSDEPPAWKEGGGWSAKKREEYGEEREKESKFSFLSFLFSFSSRRGSGVIENGRGPGFGKAHG